MYFPFHCDPLLFMSHLFLSSFVKRVPAVCFKLATSAHTDHGRVIQSFCRSSFCGSRRLRQLQQSHARTSDCCIVLRIT